MGPLRWYRTYNSSQKKWLEVSCIDPLWLLLVTVHPGMRGTVENENERIQKR